MRLEELREQLVQKCRQVMIALLCIALYLSLFITLETEFCLSNIRKMSTEEKRQLGTALTRLSTDDLSRALDIVAQGNPGFVANSEEVDLDIDAQVVFYLPVCLAYIARPHPSI